MANVFRMYDNYVDKPKRNTFDLSSQNNLTLKMGKLVPVFCKEVLPGDSFRIDPTFGLRYLPQVFPVQTRQRASIKYYYVRNRTLWKDWMDFIGKNKTDLTPPYMVFGNDENKYLSPSSIADYMGIPIYVRQSVKDGAKSSVHASAPNFVKGNRYLYVPNSGVVYGSSHGDAFTVNVHRNVSGILTTPSAASYRNANLPMDYIYGGTSADSIVPRPLAMTDSFINAALSPVSGLSSNTYLYLFRKPLVPEFPFSFTLSSANGAYMIFRDTNGTDYLYRCTSTNVTISSSNVVITTIGKDENGAAIAETKTVSIASIIGFVQYITSVGSTPSVDITLSLVKNPELCWCDVAYRDWPYANIDNPDGIRLSALPFRGIEAIYNALIRNAENNPFYIHGVKEYNKYITYDTGGSSSVYNLLEDYHCNWSDDRFTTALPSPQQGNAPLVGLTGVQGATLTTSSDDGTTSTLHLQVDSDTGKVILVDGVSSNTPAYVNDAIMSAVDYGITINDLRNVNSYQRWKENNARGYKYKDQLLSHYGVSARYDILDMPEFIGGVTRDVNVHQVTQTVTTDTGNLGDYAGQSSVMGEGHAIEHYCDEHGFIIGLMCVYPMPIYQDTLPKHLIKSDAFDYYFPEFGKIGMQPITKKELAFSQSFLEGNGDEVFGYQRAWYDYLESLDEVHGLYHTDFRNFLIARDFGQVPTLGSNFLTIDSDDVNNTFYSLDDKDKILGQIYHKVSVKRAIPMIGIPALE